MANKSVYQNYDVDALKHFGLDNDPTHGVIVGSAVVRCLEEAKDFDSMANAAGSFVQELVKACQNG